MDVWPCWPLEEPLLRHLPRKIGALLWHHVPCFYMYENDTHVFRFKRVRTGESSISTPFFVEKFDWHPHGFPVTWNFSRRPWRAMAFHGSMPRASCALSPQRWLASQEGLQSRRDLWQDKQSLVTWKKRDVESFWDLLRFFSDTLYFLWLPKPFFLLVSDWSFISVIFFGCKT